MSTRWYPLFQPGNPQLRVFLPNFWMKLIRSSSEDDPRPPMTNRVQFIVSMEMTKHDVKNYLKKIYNVETIDIRTQIRMGKTKESPVSSFPGSKQIVKEEDYKVAFVTLPAGQAFVFPDVYPKEKIDGKTEDDKKQIEQVRQAQEQLKDKAKMKPDLPGWFA